ncbi:hypothetical protein BH11ARM2_BH11ARM2_06300 [soil metagenome]
MRNEPNDELAALFADDAKVTEKIRQEVCKLLSAIDSRGISSASGAMARWCGFIPKEANLD